MEGIEQIAFAPGIEGLDQRLTFWINSLNSPFTDPFWAFMSQIKVWFPLYAIVAGVLIWRLGWKRGLIAVACIALCFFFNERINNLIKDIVERVRPCNNPNLLAMGLHVLEEGGGWSFPSGHANNSFGFAVSSAICLSKDRKARWNWYTWFILIWAALVAISRIMVARHFLGDILTGALLGTANGLLWGWIAGKIMERFVPTEQE